MNWFQLINKATEYIEDNIADDLSSKEIAKHCNVSYHYFTKTFSLITGFSLMEYVRNRRITLASYDITNTKKRIIDIAIKYGYSSNESFSRAFKKIHGINPSTARKKHINIFTHFPVLKYDIPKPNIISLRYDFLDNVSYDFIGESTYIIEEDYEQTQAYQLEFLQQFKEKHPSDETIYRVHHNISFDNLRYDYLVGYQSDEYDSDQLSKLSVKAQNAIRFISNRTQIDLIPNIKKIIYDEWEKNGFVAIGTFEIEYTIPHADGTVDFYYIVSIK
jgi:AraC family transcriptional regulator